METKQTAVELLLKIMEHRHGMLLSIDIKEAKEIEKDQIREAYYKGVRDEMQNIGSDFEDYYNKTYANDTTKGLPEENSKRRGWHY